MDFVKDYVQPWVPHLIVGTVMMVGLTFLGGMFTPLNSARWGVVFFFGKMREGKSFSCVKQLWDARRDNGDVPIWTNLKRLDLPGKGAVFLECDYGDLAEADGRCCQHGTWPLFTCGCGVANTACHHKEHQGYVFVDDVINYYPAHKWNQIPYEATTFLTETGKRHLRVYGSAHNPSQVVTGLRMLCTESYLCSLHWGRVIRLAHYEGVPPGLLASKQANEQMLLDTRWVLFTKRIGGAYDSQEVLSRPQVLTRSSKALDKRATFKDGANAALVGGANADLVAIAADDELAAENGGGSHVRTSGAEAVDLGPASARTVRELREVAGGLDAA